MSWRDRAACLGEDGELWFPKPGETEKLLAALTICDRCPVIKQCADARPTDGVGIWGGKLHPDPWAKPKPRPRPTRDRAKHCADCEKPMAPGRHSRTRLKPGQVRHMGRGLCERCYLAERRRESAA